MVFASHCSVQRTSGVHEEHAINGWLRRFHHLALVHHRFNIPMALRYLVIAYNVRHDLDQPPVVPLILLWLCTSDALRE